MLGVVFFAPDQLEFLTSCFWPFFEGINFLRNQFFEIFKKIFNLDYFLQNYGGLKPTNLGNSGYLTRDLLCFFKAPAAKRSGSEIIPKRNEVSYLFYLLFVTLAEISDEKQKQIKTRLLVSG